VSSFLRRSGNEPRGASAHGVLELAPCDEGFHAESGPASAYDPGGASHERCVIDDLCARGNTCGANAECVNIPLAYQCRCKEGFEGDGATCVDIDECARGLCTAPVCINTVGSYFCECSGGLVWNGVACVDRRLSASLYDSCAVRDDSTLWCWGESSGGPSARAAPIDARMDWASVRRAVNHTCATRRDGSLWCWGANDQGVLGHGDFAASPLPLEVFGGAKWSVIDTSEIATCATRWDGTLWCWGQDLLSSTYPPGRSYTVIPAQVGRRADIP